MTTEIFQTVLLFFLGAICLTLVCIALMIQRMFIPTAKQRLKMLRDRTEFNIQLVEQEEKRRLLTRFAYSEAGIGTHLGERAWAWWEVTPNKQLLQRTVLRHRGDGASAPLHYALVPHITRQRAAAQLRR